MNCVNNDTTIHRLKRVEQLHKILSNSLNNSTNLSIINNNLNKNFVIDSIANDNFQENFNKNFLDDLRKLSLTTQSSNFALIQITETKKKKLEVSRFTVSPTLNAVPAKLQSFANASEKKLDNISKPLSVIVNNDKNEDNCKITSPTIFESNEKKEINIELPTSTSSKTLRISTNSLSLNGLSSTSPASSIDSGVSSPAYEYLQYSSTSNTFSLSPPSLKICLNQNNNNISSIISQQLPHQRHHHRSSCALIDSQNHQQMLMFCQTNNNSTQFDYNNFIIGNSQNVNNCDQNLLKHHQRSISLTIDLEKNVNFCNKILKNNEKNEENCKFLKDINNIKNVVDEENSEKNNLNVQLSIEKKIDNQNSSNNQKLILENVNTDDQINEQLKNCPSSNNFTEKKNSHCSHLQMPLNIENNQSSNGLKSILKKPNSQGSCNRCDCVSNTKNDSTTFCSIMHPVSNNLNNEINIDLDILKEFDKIELFDENLKKKTNFDENLSEDDEDYLKCLNKETAKKKINIIRKDFNNFSIKAKSLDEKFVDFVPRKKRVSFSEHVQARIYRSNSSILGQKKKNERKNRIKRRRSESENFENLVSDENDDNINNRAAEKSKTIKELKNQNKTLDCNNNFKNCNVSKNTYVNKTDVSKTSITKKISRRDSGFENELVDFSDCEEKKLHENSANKFDLCPDCLFLEKTNEKKTYDKSFNPKYNRRLVSSVSADSVLGEEELFV